MFHCLRFDPDILVGYEVQMRSWGYLLQRAAVLGVNLCQQLSRVPGIDFLSPQDYKDAQYTLQLFCNRLSSYPQVTPQRTALLQTKMSMALTL